MTAPAPEKKPRGRPVVADDQRRDRPINIRATAVEKAKYEAVGGVDWFRQALKRAKLPTS